MKRWLTASNVLATLAVLAALGGASVTVAFAATKTFTGKQIKNDSLYGRDFRDKGIASTAFSSAARTLLTSLKGEPGWMGAQGERGTTGLKGRQGVRGPDAARAYSYITAEDTTTYIKPASGTLLNPPAGDFCGKSPQPDPCTATTPYYPNWTYVCGALSTYYCQLGTTIGASGTGVTPLTRLRDGVLGFTGDENGSFVSLMGPGNIVVTGTVVLLHRPDDNHSRVSCQPQVRKSNTSDQYVGLGAPTMVSAVGSNKLVHMTVTGAGRLESAGDYDYQVACRILDDFNPNSQLGDWYFIKGNVTATTTEL